MQTPTNDYDSQKRIFAEWLVSGAVNHVDFGPGTRALLTTTVAAKAIGCHQEYVRNLIEDGRLDAHSFNSTGGTRPSWRVQRRSVVLYLAETAKYDPVQFFARMLALLPFLTKGQLAFLTSEASKLIQKP